MKTSTGSVPLRATSNAALCHSGVFGLFSLCLIVNDGPWLPRALREKLRGPADEMLDRLEGLSVEEIEELKTQIRAMDRKGCLTGSMKAEELCDSLQSLNVMMRGSATPRPQPRPKAARRGQRRL
jgi:hypothetical protein